MKQLDKILFVCYFHGCGGEGLSYRISQHKNFRTLDARLEYGRTVIKNDLFDRKFLQNDLWYSFKTQKDADKSLGLICKEYEDSINNITQLEVVPSHFKHNELIRAFPKNRYVVIQSPKTHEDFLEKLYDRVWCYKTNNFLEMTGAISSSIWTFKKSKDKKVTDHYTKLILSNYKNLNFGQINAVVNDLAPTEENIRKLFSKYSEKLRERLKTQEQVLTGKNLYVLPYERVKNADVQQILKYFNIDK